MKCADLSAHFMKNVKKHLCHCAFTFHINVCAFLPVRVKAYRQTIYRQKRFIHPFYNYLNLKPHFHMHKHMHMVDCVIYNICQIVASAVARYPRKNSLLQIVSTLVKRAKLKP